MKFECRRDELSEAVGNVQKAVSTKSNVPILEGIMISVAHDSVVLYGSDNEIGIECTLSAMVEQIGETVIKAAIFGDIIRNLPGDTVIVETLDDGKIRIASGDAFFVLYVVQTDVFPSFPKVERKGMYTIDQHVLKKMFSQTSFAISTDDSRKVMTGLLLESDDNDLRAVAVDGFRIALRKQPVEQGDHAIKMIIPARTVSELIKIIPSTIGELRLFDGKNQAVIEFGNCRVFTRIIEGEFFNYRYILPNEYMTQVIVRRHDFLEAVERAALIINTELIRRHPVVIKVSSENYINVHALSDVGNTENEIHVEMEGEPIEVAFNPRFIIETLRAIDDEMVVVRFTTRVGQCVIRPVNNDGYTYLILPVKVSE